MSILRSYRDEGAFDRTLFSIHLEDILQFPKRLDLPSRHFVMFLAFDGRDTQDREIVNFTDIALDMGLAYLCIWGPGCERIHDLVDRVLVTREIKSGGNFSEIMTTWHDKETLSSALWFALNVAYPDELFADTCKTFLAVSVANKHWEQQIINGLSEVEHFNQHVLNNEADI